MNDDFHLVKSENKKLKADLIRKQEEIDFEHENMVRVIDQNKDLREQRKEKKQKIRELRNKCAELQNENQQIRELRNKCAELQNENQQMRMQNQMNSIQMQMLQQNRGCVIM